MIPFEQCPMNIQGSIVLCAMVHFRENVRPRLRAGDALALDFTLERKTAAELRQAGIKLGHRVPQSCLPGDFVRTRPGDTSLPDRPTVWDIGTPVIELKAADGLLCHPLDLPALRLEAAQHVAKRQSGYFRRPGINP